MKKRFEAILVLLAVVAGQMISHDWAVVMILCGAVGSLVLLGWSLGLRSQKKSIPFHTLFYLILFTATAWLSNTLVAITVTFKVFPS